MQTSEKPLKEIVFKKTYFEGRRKKSRRKKKMKKVKKKNETQEKCNSQPGRKMIMNSHHKRNKMSFEEEWDVHRAYQLLLAEHHKRVKTSDMNKDTVPKHSKKSNCSINCGCQLKELLL